MLTHQQFAILVCIMLTSLVVVLSCHITFIDLTLSDPGYFRQLTIRGGGGFKSPPPTISKNVVSIFTISYMCILLGILGMFQLEFLKNLRFGPFYSDFKMKSSENSCKNNNFAILFKIDFKYIKDAEL